MREIVLALAIVAVAIGATGCKHPGATKLEGHWRGTHAEGVGPAVQEAANTFATQTEILAHGNLVSVSIAGAKGPQATFVVDDESKSTVVLHTDKDGLVKETFAFAEDGKTMTWRLGAGRTITFEKLKE